MANKIMLTNRIILRSILPLFKVLYNEARDPLTRLLRGVDGVIQFTVRNSNTGAYLEFCNNELDIHQGIHPNPDIAFVFKSLDAMNAMFTGKTVFPSLKGLTNIRLLLKLIPLFIGLTLLMPDKHPKDPKKRELKIKLLMYMVTNALSQLNKGGDEDMMAWTQTQPDRIYQLSVHPEGPAAYLRVKGGKTKSGHGTYTRKAPFLHMKFNGIEGAYRVMAEAKDTVEAMADGDVTVEGSPEYGGALGTFMLRIQDLLMPA